MDNVAQAARCMAVAWMTWAWIKIIGYETAISDICPWQQRSK